jgi:ADP-ribose pyrophosphatase YjhB (NUDIX family)
MVRMIAVYGVCSNGDGRVLAVNGQLPGGVLRHGEHPTSAAIRHAADAGVAANVHRVRECAADVTPERHLDRIVYELRPARVELRDGAAWVDPADVTGYAPAIRAAVNGDSRPRVQRFAAYGRVTDGDGRVLLTRIAQNYPGAGRWHLPGGGTDIGEQPAEGLLRELYEETGQRGRVDELLAVTHRHHPAALGPEGYPINWHSVRALYSVAVDVPGTPSVTEVAGGSTADAAWFERSDIPKLDLTEVASLVLDP